MRKDLSGQIFNSWQVLYVSDCGTDKPTMYMCKCLQCGAHHEVYGYSLSSGKSRMCRSCSAKAFQDNKYLHDQIRNVYKGMVQRSYYVAHKSFNNYGGRGITVCQEWLDDRTKFFDWAYSHGFSDGMTVERLDNDKGYCPENCTIIPKSDQSKNRRNNIMIDIYGELKCLSEWCRIYHANPDSIKKLHNSGIEWETALEMKRNTSIRF